MARIRTIKPEFWTSEKVVELSIEARLLFIGMWNFADDHGNMSASSKRMKMQIFPADNVDIDSCLLEILSMGFISYYEIDSEKYLHINGFTKHQKVNSSVAHKVPPPKTEKKSDEADKKALEKEKEKEKEKNIKKDFDDWYLLYPRKVGKEAALKKYQSVRDRVDKEILIAGVKAYSRTVENEDQKFIAHPATWLNQGRWEDEVPTDEDWLV